MSPNGIAGRLSIALMALCLSGAGHAASLIVNGSFEGTLQNRNTWNVYTSIPGWTTTFGPGIEIRNNVAGAAQDGVNFVELDSHPLPGNSGMAQTFNSPGTLLNISYWYAARPGTTAATNGIEIWLNSVNIGKLFDKGDSGLGTSVTAWTLYSATVDGLLGANTIEFKAVGTANTLDNVSVTAQTLSPATIPTPLPAPFALMASGLAAMAVWRRRARSG